jgi:hypothetical protein
MGPVNVGAVRLISSRVHLASRGDNTGADYRDERREHNRGNECCTSIVRTRIYESVSKLLKLLGLTTKAHRVGFV